MTETLAIIDYGSGNLRSAAKAFERAAADAGKALSVIVTGDSDRVHSADRVVLPGVGAFRDCMQGLSAVAGMTDCLQAVKGRGTPIFGICVGMQLMAEHGLEHGETPGFGWFGGQVTALTPEDPKLKIPHMGWNALTLSNAGARHPVTAGLRADDHVYFVHSYAYRDIAADQVLASTPYGDDVVAIIGQDTVVATQFHPEKSQRVGQKLIRAFLDWRP